MDKNRIIALIVFGSLVGGVILYGIISAALSISNEPNFEKKAESIQIGDKTFYYNQEIIGTFPGDETVIFNLLDTDKNTFLSKTHVFCSGTIISIKYEVLNIYNDNLIAYDLKYTMIGENEEIDVNYLKHIIIHENNEYKFIEKDSLPGEYSFLKEYINHYHRPAGE